MVYYNPHKTGHYNPLYTLNNQFSHMETSLGVEPLAATKMTTGPDRRGECNANREHKK